MSDFTSRKPTFRRRNTLNRGGAENGNFSILFPWAPVGQTRNHINFMLHFLHQSIALLTGHCSDALLSSPTQKKIRVNRRNLPPPYVTALYTTVLGYRVWLGTLVKQLLLVHLSLCTYQGWNTANRIVPRHLEIMFLGKQKVSPVSLFITS